MLKVVSSIKGLPNKSAIYCLICGKGKNSILYVGQTDNLRRRIGQHLVNRDSSVTMEGSPVKIDPSHVEKVEWWEQSDFSDSAIRGAAEIVAFDILNPRLRSGSNGSKDATKLSKNEVFYNKMKIFFTGTPSGRMNVMTIEGLIERLLILEDRVATLEKHKEK